MTTTEQIRNIPTHYLDFDPNSELDVRIAPYEQLVELSESSNSGLNVVQFKFCDETRESEQMLLASIGLFVSDDTSKVNFNLRVPVGHRIAQDLRVVRRSGIVEGRNCNNYVAVTDKLSKQYEVGKRLVTWLNSADHIDFSATEI